MSKPCTDDVDWDAFEAAEDERSRAAMREMAADADAYARERLEHRAGCHVCSTWAGPAPLGGLRVHCRAVGEMRKARA